MAGASRENVWSRVVAALYETGAQPDAVLEDVTGFVKVGLDRCFENKALVKSVGWLYRDIAVAYCGFAVAYDASKMRDTLNGVDDSPTTASIGLAMRWLWGSLSDKARRALQAGSVRLPPDSASAGQESEPLEARLRKLDQLYVSGAISEDERRRRRDEIIRDV